MDNSKEVWKYIQGYEGLYEVSSLGRIKSLKRRKILKPFKDTSGYRVIGLTRNGDYAKCKVHRLVAKAFIPNPDNLPQVNHKDENKENNSADNLEWCSCSYNINYGNRTMKMLQSSGYRNRYTSPNAKNKLAEIKNKYSKPVKQLSLDGKLIKIWPSTREAEKHGFDHSTIVGCCNGKYHTHHGYRWEYVN